MLTSVKKKEETNTNGKKNMPSQCTARKCANVPNLN